MKQYGDLDMNRKTFTPLDISAAYLNIEDPYQTQSIDEVWYQGRAIMLGCQLHQSSLYPVFMLKWTLTDEYKASWGDDEDSEYYGQCLSEDMACDWDEAEILYATGEYYDPKSGTVS